MITEDFVRTLNVVSEVTEIEVKHIISAVKKMEYVEARVLLIKAMNELGYHPIQIAKKLHKATPSVRALLDSFPDRNKSDRIFSKMYNEILRKLSVN